MSPTNANDTARLVKFVDGKKAAVVASAGSFTLLDGTTYALKALIGDDPDPNHPELQQLKFYVGGTLRLTTTLIDDEFQGGHVGVWRETDAAKTNAIPWDNFKCGVDTNADEDVNDPNDYVYADHAFASTALTLTHDDNGNMTGDGLFTFTYDAWNRLVGAWYAAGDPNAVERVATYAYDGMNRRVSKVVANQGEYVVHNSSDGGMDGIQAGNRTEHHYWTEQWQLAESRNGMADTLAQWVYGTQYVDEPVVYDRNTDPNSNDDCLDLGSSRYIYSHVANFRGSTITGDNGSVLERLDDTAYGLGMLFQGDFSGTEISRTMLASLVGNPLHHRGLIFDAEIRRYHNRHRAFSAILGTFTVRDPLALGPQPYIGDGPHWYIYLRSQPFNRTDSAGLESASDFCDAVDPGNKFGLTACDGKGNLVSCVFTCTIPGNSIPKRCAQGYSGDDSCPPIPTPPSNAACYEHFCNDIISYCTCESEKAHRANLTSFDPNICDRAPKGRLGLARGDLKYTKCLAAWSEAVAHEIAADCFRDHGASTACAAESERNSREEARKFRDQVTRECGAGWHPTRRQP